MRKSLFPLLLAAVAAVPIALAQQKSISTQALADWKAGNLGVSVSCELDPSIAALPRAQDDAEAAIDASFTGLFFNAVSPLVVDSSHTVSDLLGSDPAFYSWMSDLARAAVKDRLYLSPDFTRLLVHYTFALFTSRGIGTPLYPSRDFPIRRRLGFVPSREFSGLVIYAGDMVPAVGLSRDQYAAPALFPRLFDEEMNLVLDRSMVRPAALARWGMVGYADSIDEDAILKRTGQHPLRVAARAVFGINSTDIVLSTEAAGQILSLPANIEILKEGRILVIYHSLK